MRRHKSPQRSLQTSEMEMVDPLAVSSDYAARQDRLGNGVSKYLCQRRKTLLGVDFSFNDL